MAVTLPPSLIDAPWASLAAALGIGLLIGLERERRKGAGPRRVPAGIRTFTLTALLGAAAVTVVDGDALITALALAVGALAAVSYWRSTARDPGVTTGVALLITLVLGGLAMRDAVTASALGVAVAVLLAARTPMHRFVRQAISEDEFGDALMLAAATLVVLPLVPDRYLGPYHAFNPRTAWTIVILMMAVGGLGHMAQRLLGAGLGLAAAGLASGFVSSAATIAAMGERARRHPAVLGPAVAGAVLSSLATVLQMVLVLGATSAPTLQALAWPLAAAGAVAAAYAAAVAVAGLRQAPAVAVPASGHAFSLGKALGLAALVSAVMVASAVLQAHFGQTGLWVAAALAGLADTHSAAVSVAALVAAGKLPPGDAVVPILCALSSNTLTKAVLAVTAGGPRYAARILPGLAGIIGAAWLAHALLQP